MPVNVNVLTLPWWSFLTKGVTHILRVNPGFGPFSGSSRQEPVFDGELDLSSSAVSLRFPILFTCFIRVLIRLIGIFHLLTHPLLLHRH